MTQATPGPWTIEYAEMDQAWIVDATGETIVGFGAEDKVFWETVVRAVNERPELIAALETTIGNLMNVQIDLSTGGTKAKADKSLSEIITRAVAILEKAKAQ